MKQRSMTSGNIVQLLILFTLPLLIGNIFQQFYSMADTFIVGRTIGVDALAAVGCTGSITFLIIGFAQGFTSGLSIRVAQRYGAGDEEGVRRGIACGALLSLGCHCDPHRCQLCLYPHHSGCHEYSRGDSGTGL